MALALASVTWSDDPATTAAKATLLMASATYIVAAAATLPLEKMLVSIAYGMAVAVALSAIFAVIDPELGRMSTWMHNGAWKGIYDQKNALGRSAGQLIVLALALNLANVVSKGIAACSALLGLIALVGSRSATGMISAGVVCGATVLLSRPRWRRLGISVIVAICLTAILGFAASGATYGDALRPNLTLTGRTLLWQAALNEWREAPILGFGYDAFWKSDSRASANVRAVTWTAQDAHNGLIDILLQLGLMGAIVLMAVVWRDVRWWKSMSRHRMGPVVTASLGYYFLSNITEVTVMRPTNLVWLLYLFAVTALRFPPWTSHGDR